MADDSICVIQLTSAPFAKKTVSVVTGVGIIGVGVTVVSAESLDLLHAGNVKSRHN
jgi:hypothetical protein